MIHYTSFSQDRDLTTQDAEALAELDDLRTNDPIVWALINGVQTSRSIAKRINWPHDWVLITLREFKRDSIVYDIEGKASVIWQLNDDDYLRLKDWVARQWVTGGLFNPEQLE